jgi:sugar lactone lactonase YvrE
MTDNQQVEVVLDIRASVGEGPVWDDRTNTLVWVDIMSNSVHIFDPASGHDRAIDVGQPVGAAGLREGGGLVLALRDGFAVLDKDFGDLRWVARVEQDLPTNRMNDGKCDAAGRFWAGTMAFEATAGVASLYRLDPDYRVTRVLTNVTLSNGMDWTADNRHMYFIDTPTHRVDAFDFDFEKGTLGERRTIVNVPAEVGAPDGMTVDAEGALWVAIHGSGAIHRSTPDGRLEPVVRVPVRQVTSCAFGGPDLGDLYITSMTYGLSPEALAEQPLALARVRRVGPVTASQASAASAADVHPDTFSRVYPSDDCEPQTHRVLDHNGLRRIRSDQWWLW